MASETQLRRPWAEQGKRLRRARERTGLSQDRFAPNVGVTPRHLIRLEKGEHQPSAETLGRIAGETGQTPESFGYSDDDEEEDPSMTLDELLRLHVRRVVEREVARVGSADEMEVVG